jgi:hypothetical protein
LQQQASQSFIQQNASSSIKRTTTTKVGVTGYAQSQTLTNQVKSKENETLTSTQQPLDAKYIVSQRSNFAPMLLTQLHTTKQTSSSSAHRHTVSHQPLNTANHVATAANPTASFKGHNKSSGRIQMSTRNP